MNTHLQEIRDKQKASWNHFSPGWKKWNKELLEHMQPATDAIINSLQPNGKQKILDIASGAGEPAFSISQKLNGGEVILTDLADAMLNIARENAQLLAIKNVSFQACDVSALPFVENSFDLVSCRMGFMFFPNLSLAAKEIYRVLKPGGKLATTVWGTPDKNLWITLIGDVIKRNMQLPEVPLTTDKPNIFRCAAQGMMKNILTQAGFKNTQEKELACTLNCDNADSYWQMMTEIAAPVVGVLNKADEKMKEKIKQEVIYLLNAKYPEGNIALPGSEILLYGEK